MTTTFHDKTILTGGLLNQAFSERLLAASNLSDLPDVSVARTSLGLLSMATQAANAVNISGGTIAGVTLALAAALSPVYGGTGLTSPGAVGNILVSNGSGWVSSAVSGVYTPSMVGITGGAIDGTTIGATTPSTVKATSLTVGALGYTDTGILMSLAGSSNSYQQAIIRNTNSGNTASADVIVSNNNGTATTYYGNFGINSSAFSGAGSLNLPNATYLYAANGDLVIGTATSNLVRFVVNSGATDAASISTAGLFTLNSGLTAFGAVGVGIAGTASAGLNIAQTALTGVSIQGINLSITAPSTATTSNVGIQSTLATAATAFVQTYAVHFAAGTITKGAGSTINNAMGFWAQAGMAGQASSTYGFYSDINSATNTYQLYLFGSAVNYIASTLNIGTTSFGVSNLRVAPSTISNVNARAIEVNGSFGSSATGTGIAFNSDISSAATAYTVAFLTHFNANSTTKGAGSTINAVAGFVAANGIVNDVAASTTYGFYSLINKPVNATGWQLYMGGTADSYIAGGLRVTGGTNPPILTTSGIDMRAGYLHFIDAAGAANKKLHSFQYSGSTFVGQFVNDAFSAAINWLVVAGDQTAVTGITIGANGSNPTITLAGGGSVVVGPSDPGGADKVRINGALTISSATMIRTKTTFTNGAAAAAGTLTNAPAAGNPTKWIPIDDNGTTRYIPAW